MIAYLAVGLLLLALWPRRVMLWNYKCDEFEDYQAKFIAQISAEYHYPSDSFVRSSSAHCALRSTSASPATWRTTHGSQLVA
jgi:hypothetical protein